MNLSSALLVSLGTIVGGVTLNPAILGSLTSAGGLLKVFAEGKDFQIKREKANVARESYSSMLAELRTLIRGADYSSEKLIQTLWMNRLSNLKSLPIVSRKKI